MIALLTGILRQMEQQYAILDVNGVGYEVMVTTRAAAQMGALGQAATLHIITQVREDAITLFGFTTRTEKDAFVRLTTVQGVGAKMALSLLSAFDPEQIWRAIVADDKKALTQADGVGPKLAARLVTELKDFASKQIFGATSQKQTKSNQINSLQHESHLESEAVSALTHLGYGVTEAVRAVTQVANQNEGADLQTLIKLALREVSA